MPRIAYLRAHGANDYLLHFAFFELLEARGLLNRYEFVLDTIDDRLYCQKLKKRFPTLKLIDEISQPRRMMNWFREKGGRYYGSLGYLDRYDAVCEGCGGHIHGHYMQKSPFAKYPRTKRRAILFQSLEDNALQIPSVAQAVREADLVICRTKASADRGRAIGAKWVVESTDIVLGRTPQIAKNKSGFAVALRIPNFMKTDHPYLDELRNILNFFEKSNLAIDLIRIENPIGKEMEKKGYGIGHLENINMFYGDSMYDPFQFKRDLVVSCRLHTTLEALLNGNRKIFQFQMEGGTNKISEIFQDIHLKELIIYSKDYPSLNFINRAIDTGPNLTDDHVSESLKIAREKVSYGLDEFEQWLHTL